MPPKAQLDKMDALAYLLADLLCGELLLEEANSIGKRAAEHPLATLEPESPRGPQPPAHGR